MDTKFMVLLKRKPGMSPEAFRNHYENNHIPLGATFIGHLLVEFSRHYPGTMSDFASDDWEDGRMSGTDAGCAYDAISIYRFRDQAAMAEMAEILQRPEVSRALSEDENRFLDRAACRMGLCDVVAGAGMVSKSA
jgi:hypothetical protein